MMTFGNFLTTHDFLRNTFFFSVAFFPLQIGDHVFIGEGSIVNAAVVSSYVYIGKNVIIGRRCVLKDCCYIEDNSVVPPETVVPTFTRFSGSPAKRIGELPENAQASDLCPVLKRILKASYLVCLLLNYDDRKITILFECYI